MGEIALLDRLIQVEQRFEELERLLADPDVVTDYHRVRELAQERAGILELAETAREYREVSNELHETRGMLDGDLGDDMRSLVTSEVERLEQREADLQQRLRLLLLPKDPNDQRNVIMEIRAGTGGDEASLFAADLYRMYVRYSEAQGWKTDLLSANSTGIGGFKEVILEIDGEGAYSRLKHESGVHRVQRVPVTESSGRIHTSTATVAVLPEADEVDVQINSEELRIDVYRASGHGGQSVNTTDSAVRITHLPTGLVVSCQDERSQLQNKMRAMSILRARLYDMEQRRLTEQVETARRSQVGTGERSEKVRTYNFPQNRVTDHRIGLSSHRLGGVLAGNLGEFIEQLVAEEQAEKLRLAGYS
jgi:peptide chain release factor 1